MSDAYQRETNGGDIRVEFMATIDEPSWPTGSISAANEARNGWRFEGFMSSETALANLAVITDFKLTFCFIASVCQSRAYLAARHLIKNNFNLISGKNMQTKCRINI